MSAKTRIFPTIASVSSMLALLLTCVNPSYAQSFPGLNLENIPWHNGSGAWGEQVPLEFPALPDISRSVEVSTAAEFGTQAAIAGTEITITSGWEGNSTVGISANDIDVIIPSGVAIGAVLVGASRVRIRGSVPGTHSGGRMGQLRHFGTSRSDITIDGVDMNGDSSFDRSETNQAFRIGHIERLAVLNTRAIAAGYIWLGEARHVTIVNSNLYHGAATRANVGYAEGWGIRNTAGPITIIDSRIEGTRYVNIRSQSVGGAGELLYVSGSTLVALHEARNVWFWNNLNNGPWSGQGGVIEDSRFYSYGNPGGCLFGHELNTSDVDYSRVSNSEFFSGGNSNFTQSYLNNVLDENSGNTFYSLTTAPGWSGPGDPTDIPLPSGMTLNTAGETPCTFSYDPDSDGDGLSDSEDPDDDNDGMTDVYENTHGLDPFDSTDAALDPDVDGLINLEEFQVGSNPNDPDTDGDGVIDGLDSEPLFAYDVDDAGDLWMVSPALIYW